MYQTLKLPFNNSCLLEATLFIHVEFFFPDAFTSLYILMYVLCTQFWLTHLLFLSSSTPCDHSNMLLSSTTSQFFHSTPAPPFSFLYILHGFQAHSIFVMNTFFFTQTFPSHLSSQSQSLVQCCKSFLPAQFTYSLTSLLTKCILQPLVHQQSCQSCVLSMLNTQNCILRKNFIVSSVCSGLTVILYKLSQCVMPASQVIEELLNKNLIMRTLNWGSWKDMNNQEISMELQNSF